MARTRKWGDNGSDEKIDTIKWFNSGNCWCDHVQKSDTVYNYIEDIYLIKITKKMDYLIDYFSHPVGLLFKNGNN